MCAPSSTLLELSATGTHYSTALDDFPTVPTLLETRDVHKQATHGAPPELG
jgi:hypothetical protein